MNEQSTNWHGFECALSLIGSGKQLSKHLGVYATESSGTELTSPYYAKVENGYEAILPQHYEQQSTAAKYVSSNKQYCKYLQHPIIVNTI